MAAYNCLVDVDLVGLCVFFGDSMARRSLAYQRSLSWSHEKQSARSRVASSVGDDIGIWAREIERDTGKAELACARKAFG